MKNPLAVTTEGPGGLKQIWSGISERSGFPEPYLSERLTTYRRWSNTYSQQLIREDIRDLTAVKSVSDMETLYFLLPSRIGSPISVPFLSSDLKVSYNSVGSWLSIFERFFLIFTITPWARKIARAIQKERKVYLWDTPRIKEPAARFENMVALELRRAVTTWNDLGHGTFSLHFIKNKEQQEVDFLIAEGGDPFLFGSTFDLLRRPLVKALPQLSGSKTEAHQRNRRYPEPCARRVGNVWHSKPSQLHYGYAKTISVSNRLKRIPRLRHHRKTRHGIIIRPTGVRIYGSVIGIEQVID